MLERHEWHRELEIVGDLSPGGWSYDVSLRTARLIFQILKPGKESLAFDRTEGACAGKDLQHRQIGHLAITVGGKADAEINGRAEAQGSEPFVDYPTAAIWIGTFEPYHKRIALASNLEFSSRRLGEVEPAELTVNDVSEHGPVLTDGHRFVGHANLEPAE